MAKRVTAKYKNEESSESEAETETAKNFHRRLSTSIKSSVSKLNFFSLLALFTV